MSITSEIKFQSLSSRALLVDPFSSGIGRAATVKPVGHNGSSQLLQKPKMAAVVVLSVPVNQLDTTAALTWAQY